MLEVVSFLATSLREGKELEKLLLEIETVYFFYGREGFPWKLSTVDDISIDYRDRSDFSKIKVRGIPEDKPCPHNNCGGMESVQNLIQTRSTDEGKTAIRYCIECGRRRH
jgi:hypothetical protein